MGEELQSEILATAAQEVLETMFFAELTEGSEWPDSPGEPQLCARARFRGSPSGTLCLRIPARTARTIAADFLGAENEEGLSDAQVGDVVCELANMICGSVLSRLENETGFDIFRPELVSGGRSGSAGQDGSPAVSRILELANGRVEVSLRLDQVE